ncbi:MAG: PKD domain-containing protein [Candidatus Vogelbacteria bacterium]
MRYFTNILAAVLILGMFVFPSFIIRAEDNVADSVTASALTAAISAPANNATIQTGVATSFTASGTAGEPPYAYTWDFGDGSTAFGQSYSKTYTTVGAKTVALTITDFAGHTANATITVTITEPVVVSPLTASITAPANNTSIQTGVATSFTASANGGEPPYAYTWDFGDGSTAFGQSYSKTYTTAGAKTVALTITDFADHTANATITVTITTPPPPPPPISDDTTPPTQPTIITSTINANATSTTGALTITWAASTDPTVAGQTTSGLAGYSYLIDHNPTTAPDATIETTTTSLTQTLTNGTWWIHLIAKDNAGNISAPITHYGPMGVETTVAPDPLTITNIRVTDITYNSAIIHWTTNRTADSRVIYDTVSHASITGQSAPNFGYASSTATTDADTKVTEHAVSVTDLLPSTAYYFRVLSQ